MPDDRDFCGTSDAKIHKCNRLLAAGVLADNGQDVGFLDYLTDFWQEGGEYVRKAKEVKEKPMDRRGIYLTHYVYCGIF
jgi:hypothetical protein